MKTTNFFLAITAMVGIMFTSCTKNDLLGGDVPTSLKNTNWKLVGITDTQTGVLKKLKPTDCKQCYTFTFDTDTTALGYTVSNEMRIGGLNPILIGGTKIYEQGDAGIYYDALFSVRSYEFKGNELKLFYDNNNKYLFYKIVH